MRLNEVLTETGFAYDYLMKLVEAEVVTPIYHVYRVRDARDAIVTETNEIAARTEAARIGGYVEPVGRAWYVRDQIEKLITAKK